MNDHYKARVLEKLLAIDWGLLRGQKKLILDLVDRIESNHWDALPPDAGDLLTGILHLIDHIQDTAADDLGIEGVFE